METSKISRLHYGVAIVGGLLLAASATAHPPSFNAKGNIIIADQYNNRVIEVDPAGHLVWQFGDGSTIAGPHSTVGPNDAERVGELTLVAGTGVPGGAEPGCDNGCADNRVMLVDRSGHIVWQYGQAGVTGSDPNQLNTPVAAAYLPNDHIFITDQGNQRIIEVTRDKHKIVWQYGTTGVAGADANQLNSPNSAELLDNGHVLIADESNNRVIEVTRAGQIVWQYGDPNDTTILNAPAFASRLRNGNTLIPDSGNARVLEVDRHGNVVFNYDTNLEGGSGHVPVRAIRLENGNTIISDQGTHDVWEINSKEKVVFRYGMTGVAGNGPDQLNGPYDAKVVGDYTGLTPPHGHDFD